jgi:hypothetical protein
MIYAMVLVIWHMKGRQRSFDSLLTAAFELFDAQVVII